MTLFGRVKIAIAIGLAGSLFVAILLPVVAIPSIDRPAVWLVRILFALLTAEVSARLTESLLALTWRPEPPAPRLVPAPSTRVAVLMTICDDASPLHVGRLRELLDAGYDVFVLDDSKEPTALPLGIAERARIVRRTYRGGAKAGNLNHWLAQWCHAYDFCCVLDSDSWVSAGSLRAMVETALHENNVDVALFQAKIAAELHQLSTLHERLLALGCKVRARVLERVHSPLGILLSQGHNQLLRLAALRTVGGFDERLSAEDTALSLSLRARGWRIVIVDTWTYDTEPRTFEAYARRTIRWARQTAQLFGHSWSDAPLRLRLLLCRHLLSYATPIFSTALFLISVSVGGLSIRETARFVSSAITLAEGYEPFGHAIWVGTFVTLVDIGARLCLLSHEGEERGLWLASIVWGHAASIALCVPLGLSLGRAVGGAPLAFVPTNSRHVSTIAIERRVRRSTTFSSFVLLLCIAASLVRNPGAILFAWNTVWLLSAALAPLLPTLGALRAGVRERC